MILFNACNSILFPSLKNEQIVLMKECFLSNQDTFVVSYASKVVYLSTSIAHAVISLLRVCLDGYASIRAGVSDIRESDESPFQRFF